MYQGYDGQWYEDNGEPANYPDQINGGGGPPPPAGAPPPVYTIGNGPNANQPAQPMPDYDDAHDPYQGSWQINDSTGGWSWLPKGYSTTHQGDAMAPRTDTGGGGGGQPASPASDPSFWGSYTPPTPYQFTPYGDFTPFTYDSYTPLTADQAAAEPGYAFAAQQGRGALDTAAAMKGNVLSGAQLKDLYAWGNQFAGQNYQSAERRNEGIYNMNRGNAYGNWAANESGKYQTWAGNQQYGLGAWEANNGPSQFAANFGQQQRQLTLADLLSRFNTSVDANTRIATAGAS